MGTGIGVLVKWVGSSVSGLVVIAGIICIILSAFTDNSMLIPLGIMFVLAGLFGAIAITAIIRGRI